MEAGQVPPGALIAVLQKGVQYVEAEASIAEVGTQRGGAGITVPVHWTQAVPPPCVVCVGRRGWVVGGGVQCMCGGRGWVVGVGCSVC